jgi:SAM-dependent methyltransferase
METRKAQSRRRRDGFFERYITGRGIDIGCGDDPITSDCVRCDVTLGHGDAHELLGYANNAYDWVYSSHLLEHLTDPERALRRWWELVKAGGVLILFVPHRDLYEKKRTLPSRWNREHTFFLLPDKDEAPNTVSLRGIVDRALEPLALTHGAAIIEEMKVCDAGHTITDPTLHSDGEYSIEVIVRKLKC